MPCVLQRRRAEFKPVQPDHGFALGVATHLWAGPQRCAHSGPLYPAEHAASVVFIELDAPNARWFSLEHTGDGAGNRGCNAAGATARAAVHGRALMLLK